MAPIIHFTVSNLALSIFASVDNRRASMREASFYAGFGGQPQGLYVGLRGQVVIEQPYLFVGQRFRLLFGEAAGYQVLHEPVGVEGYRFLRHARILV